jgi:hypothetical protein
VTAHEKIDAAVNDLLTRGVAWHTAAPPHYRLFWVLGWHIPPMLFQSFLGIVLVNGLFFGLGFAAMAWVAERHHAAVELMLTFGTVGGLVVGLICGIIYRFQAWRLGLPRWADYNPHHEADAEDPGW